MILRVTLDDWCESAWIGESDDGLKGAHDDVVSENAVLAGFYAIRLIYLLHNASLI
jgi:hypothetical protein